MKKKNIAEEISRHITKGVRALEKMMDEKETISRRENILRDVIKECFEASQLYATHAQDLSLIQREEIYRRIEALKIAYNTGQDYIRLEIITALSKCSHH